MSQTPQISKAVLNKYADLLKVREEPDEPVRKHSSSSKKLSLMETASKTKEFVKKALALNESRINFTHYRQSPRQLDVSERSLGESASTTIKALSRTMNREKTNSPLSQTGFLSTKKLSNSAGHLLELISSLKTKEKKSYRKHSTPYITTENLLLSPGDSYCSTPGPGGVSQNLGSILQKVHSNSISHRSPSPKNLPAITPSNNVTDLYNATNEYIDELKLIVNNNYNETVSNLIDSNKCHDFITFQDQRIKSLLDLFKKKFVNPIVRQNSLNEEFWKVISLDIKKIFTNYNDYLQHLDIIRERMIDENDKTVFLDHDILEGFKLLVDRSNLKMNIKLTSPEYARSAIDNYMNSIHRIKINYRTRRNYNVNLYEVFEKMESHVDHLNDMLEQKNMELDNLKINFQKLEDKNKDLINHFTEENLSMIKLSKQQIAAIPRDTKENSEITEKMWRNQLNNLESELARYRSENEKYATLLQQIRKDTKKSTMTAQLKFQEKSIQVDFPAENAIIPRSVRLIDIIEDVKNEYPGSMQSLVWSYSMLNLIFADKYITDFGDDNDNRPRKPLKNYLIEWFLKRFGMYGFVETLLKDFVYNIKYLAPYHDRVKLFCHLCGIRDKVEKPVNAPPKQFGLNLDLVKREFFMSVEALRIYMRIIYLIKTSIANFHSFKFCMNSDHVFYNPLLPNVLHNGQDFIPIDVARTVMSEILEENGSSEECGLLDEKFGTILQNDLYTRIMHEKSQQKSPEDVLTEQNTKVIRFDFFVYYLMDLVAEYNIIIIKKIYSVLKIEVKRKNELNLSFEEFRTVLLKEFPNKSQIWYEHVYAKLMETQPSSDKIPFSTLLTNIVSCVFSCDIPKKGEVTSLLVADTVADLTPDAKLGTSPQHNRTNSYKKTTTTTFTRQNTKLTALGNNLTLPIKSSLAFSSNMNNVMSSYKQGFNLGRPSINAVALQIYDAVSSIIIIDATLELLQDVIGRAKNSSDTLKKLYSEMEDDLLKIPVAQVKLGKYESLNSFNQLELVSFLEGVWKKMRWILFFCFKK